MQFDPTARRELVLRPSNLPFASYYIPSPGIILRQLLRRRNTSPKDGDGFPRFFPNFTSLLFERSED